MYNTKTYILSKNGYLDKIVKMDELPYWILLYDEYIDGMQIEDHQIWNDTKFCENSVKQNGLSLKYAKYKSYRLCEIAVIQNGNALEYVPNHIIDYDLCMLAVKNYRFAIKFVPKKYQTEELCMMAIKGKYKSGILHAKENLTKTDPEYTENGYILCYVQNQTTKVIDYALKCNPDAYKYVISKTKEIEIYSDICRKKIEDDSKYYERLFSYII
jgi:hypothetical protein